ncbi:hypothetical protein D3C80_1871180 [compost metagenome]
MKGVNPQAEAQQPRALIDPGQFHLTHLQQTQLPEPIVQPLAQRRITPHHPHIQWGATITHMLHAQMHVELFEHQPMCMARGGHLVEQVTHALPGRQLPAGIL